MFYDTLFLDVRLATMASDAPYGAIADGALAVKDGKIAWVGPARDLPGDATAATVRRGEGCWLTPGLIDCHTHLVFAGNRAAEFEQRLNGATYEDIAKAGGGIMSTVRATRAAGHDELLEAAGSRALTLMAEGVTTIEIKSGYGLDTPNEKKMLQVARALGESLPVSVRTTFLGAHAVPEEFAGRADEYIDLVCEKMLPAVAKLSDAVDAFCDRVGFSREQTERVFQAAEAHSLPLKLHAEQLSDQLGAELAADYLALSADHLEYANESGIAAMARSGTVAVLLPGAFYFLRETRLPPIGMLRKHRVPIALASDINPGSSPIVSLLANMNMAATLFRLTPDEILRGVTVNAARALGLADRGALAKGMRADLALWDIDSPAELCYWMGGLHPRLVFFNGVPR